MDEGAVMTLRELEFPAVVVSRADCRRAIRDNEHNTREGAGKIELGRYDLFNHFFDIRDAPDLLFLQGRKDESWRGKWVSDGRLAVGTLDGRILVCAVTAPPNVSDDGE